MGAPSTNISATRSWLWNAPLDDAAHQRHACLAALGMLQALETLNATLSAEHAAEGLAYRPLRIGIGLESGSCFVGNLGSAQRFNYSVIGDAVNVAARLEARSKDYGLPVIVGERVRNACPDLAFLEIDQTQLRGRSEVSRLYALLGDGTLAQQPLWPELEASHAAVCRALRPGATGELAALLAQARTLAEALGVGAAYARFAALVEQRRQPAA